MTLAWPWKVKCDFGSIDALYVYTYTPAAQIKLPFALRQAVFEIEPIFIYATLTWPWKVKCDFGSIDALYVYTYTPEGPN